MKLTKKPKYSLGGWIKDNKQGVLGGLQVAGGIGLAALSGGTMMPLATGLITGGASNIAGEIQGDKQAAMQNEAMKQQELLMNKQNRLQQSLNTIQNTNQSIFAIGGELTKYNGPRHEQGGIQLPNAEVEGGETRGTGKTKDYIFSDRVRIGEETFADRSKLIENKYKFTENDILSKNAKDRELNNLKLAQELTNANNEMRDVNKLGKKMMRLGGIIPNQQPYNYSGTGIGTLSNPNEMFPKEVAMDNLYQGNNAILPTFQNNINNPIIPEVQNEQNLYATAGADLLGIGISALPNLMAAAANNRLKKDIRYKRVGTHSVTPEYLDPTSQLQNVQSAYAGANSGIRQTARGAGSYLSNRIASASGEARSRADVLNTVGNANVQIGNQAKQFNAQQEAQSDRANAEITMREIQDRIGIRQNTISLASSGLNNAAQTYNLDKRAQQQLAIAGGENKQVAWIKGDKWYKQPEMVVLTKEGKWQSYTNSKGDVIWKNLDTNETSTKQPKTT